ncbi:hypothetical protein MNBD_IGNAVI01-208, partial [hydrothermal vent metagenome]
MDYSEDAEKFFLNEENKKKRKELEEKFGGDFHKAEDSDLPPEIENEFLKNVEEFERQHENAKNIKVIDLIGNPKFKKIDELSGKALSDAIDEVLDLYGKHEINISVIEEEEVSDSDFYVFLTEELPEEETENIRMPGWTTNYIYEEFHPNDKLDSKDAIEHLIYDFLTNSEYKNLHIAKEKLLNIGEEKVTREKFIESFAALFEDVDELIVREEIVFN